MKNYQKPDVTYISLEIDENVTVELGDESSIFPLAEEYEEE